MSRGFTLFEIIVAIAITVLVAAVSVPLWSSLQTFAAVEAVRSPLVADLRVAQARAAAGLGARGVYLENARYTVYAGTSYAARNVVQDRVVTMDNGVAMERYGFAGGSGVIDLRFAAGTGAPSDVGTVAVRHATDRAQFVAVRASGLVEETRSGTAVLIAEGDATLSKIAQNTNDGAATYLQSYPWEPSNTRRSAVRFSLAAIPRGATVTSAVLTLQPTQTYGATRTVALHRITKPWDERAVTWQSTGAQLWAAAGGDVVALPSATAQLTWTGTLTPVTWNIAGDVQQMVNGTVDNDGWLVKDASEDSTQAYWFFSSREGATPPRLEVQYAF